MNPITDESAAIEDALLASWRRVGEVMADSVERRLAPRFDGLAGRLSGVEDRLSGVEDRVSGVEGRLSGVEGRLSGVEGELSVLGVRLSGVEDRVSGVEGQLVGVGGRLSALEQGQAELTAQVGQLENSTLLGFQRIEANLEEIRGLFAHREREGRRQPKAPRTRRGG